MATAIPLADCGGFTGPARLFAIDPPLRDPSSGNIADHVIVCVTTMGGPRIEVYPGRPSGSARSMQPLPGSCILQRAVSLDDACVWALSTAGGYEIADSAAEFADGQEQT
ncbi:hypothetical protein RCF19_03825 [Rhodococcus qingshengii]